MEEAELLKERLQAITDKRKLQEDIAQKRVKIEEEKIKHHHLKKKALREKWLLDGLSSLTAEEHQNMLQQNEEDQQQIKHLELIIDRLEQEIDALEKEEVQLSAKEVRVLQRLKSVERSTEDIIKAAKAQMQEEPLCDIYAGIPDLPPSYKPSFVRKLETQDNEDEPRKALFAMEIKVEKDIKSGKSTVLSSIPVPSSEFQDTGVKVYDDGRKSVYAVRSEGKAKQNGVDPLAPIEVEDLLRKATEKHSESPTEYHEPVFSNSYSNSETQRGHIAPRMKKQNSPSDINSWNQNGLSTKETLSNPSTPREVYQIKGPFPEEERFSQCQTSVMPQKQQPMSEFTEHMLTPLADHHEHLKSMEGCTTESPSSGIEEDMHYNVVHATPCLVDDAEPVTMIFMGYKHADENESKPISDYEGIIHAELVIIDDDDDDEDEKRVNEKAKKGLSASPIMSNYVFKSYEHKEVTQNPTNHNVILNPRVPYMNSMPLKEQDAILGSNDYQFPMKHIIDDGTEDPSLTALRIRMAKLGKKVI